MKTLALTLLLCAPALAAPARTTVKLSHEPMTPNPGPSALIHLGKGFKKTGPLNLIVHFHGILNCISVTVEDKGGSCRGKGAQGHKLISQVDASGVNAVFIALEVAYAQNNTNPGKLAQDGFLRSIIEELLPKIGELADREYSMSDVKKVALTSHSGGYAALCESLARGKVNVTAVLLFDSLYPNKKKKGPKDDQCFNKYVSFAKAKKGTGQLKVVYTQMGGTMANSQALSADVKAAVHKNRYYDDRKGADAALMKKSELARPFVFLRTSATHDDSVRKWYEPLLRRLRF